MPHAAAMVGHGGFGTTMAALAAGVPQVVVPLFAPDQYVNGEHVAAVGAGLNLDGGPTAIPALAEAVERLVAEPEYRAAARAVADEMSGLPPVAPVPVAGAFRRHRGLALGERRGSDYWLGVGGLGSPEQSVPVRMQVRARVIRCQGATVSAGVWDELSRDLSYRRSTDVAQAIEDLDARSKELSMSSSVAGEA